MVQKKISFLLALIFWASAVGPMAILAWENHPSLLDDFCFAWIGKTYGILEGAYMYYTNWSGRYFANLVMHTNPLVFSTNFRFFAIPPLFLLVFGFFSGWWTFKNVFKLSKNAINLWTISLVFQAFCLYSIPGIYQLFFWYSGFYYYLSFHLVLLFFNILYFGKANKLQNFCLFLLMFCIIGSSEITMLVFSAMFFLYLIQQIWMQEMNASKWLLVFFWLFCIGLVLLSPGNAIRSNQGHNEWPQVFLNFKAIAWQILHSLLGNVLLYLWLAFIFIIGLRLNSKHPMIAHAHAFWLIFFVLGAEVLGILALAIGLNERAASERILSIFDLFSALLLSFLVIKWAGNFKSYHGFLKSEKATFTLLMGMILCLYINPNFKLFYQEIIQGRQRKFAKESKERFIQLQQDQRAVVPIKKLSNTNSAFFTEDFSSDSTHLWCKCVAKYYGKKAVYRVD